MLNSCNFVSNAESSYNQSINLNKNVLSSSIFLMNTFLVLYDLLLDSIVHINSSDLYTSKTAVIGQFRLAEISYS